MRAATRRGPARAARCIPRARADRGGGVWRGGGGVWGGVGGVWGGGGGVWGGGGLAEYGTPGIGGRLPVVWSSSRPRRSDHQKHAAPGGDPRYPAWADTRVPRREAAVARVEDRGWIRRPVREPPASHVGLKADRRWREPSRDPENTGVIIDGVNGLIDNARSPQPLHRRHRQAAVLRSVILPCPSWPLRRTYSRTMSHRAQSIPRATARGEHGSLGPSHTECSTSSTSRQRHAHETPEKADDTVLHDLLEEFADEGISRPALAPATTPSGRFFPAAGAARGNEEPSRRPALTLDDHRSHCSPMGDRVTAHAPAPASSRPARHLVRGSEPRSAFLDRTGSGPAWIPMTSGPASPGSERRSPSPWIAGQTAARTVAAGQPSSSGQPGKLRSVPVAARGGPRAKAGQRLTREDGAGAVTADGTVQTLSTRAASAFRL